MNINNNEILMDFDGLIDGIADGMYVEDSDITKDKLNQAVDRNFELNRSMSLGANKMILDSILVNFVDDNNLSKGGR